MEANQLSREAHARLQAEYDDLTTRGRIEVAEKIERARELGDLAKRESHGNSACRNHSFDYRRDHSALGLAND